MIGGEDVFRNSFAASGRVPGKYGHRTLLEHRARLVSLPLPPPPADGAAAPPDPSPTAEAEAALRHLGATLDASGMAAIDPRYLVALRCAAAPHAGGDARALTELARAPPAPALPPPAPGLLARAAAALTGGGVSDLPYLPPPRAPLSWHAVDGRVAVATGEDGVAVYDLRRGAWEAGALRSASVRGVRALAFRPGGGSLVAVGCAGGVALWPAARDAPLRWLAHARHTRVVALSWAPDGAALVSASADERAARVWDVGTGASAPAGPAALVRFSPAPGADVALVAAPARPAFRLVRTADWAAERWGALAGPVRAAAWAPGGRMVMIAAAGEPALHVLRVEHAAAGTVTELVHTEVVEVPRVGPGGTARCIAWDPHGERVAVVFDVPPGDEPSREGFALDEQRRYAVALYATSLAPTFSMAPVGYIGGPPRSGPPTAAVFKPRCEGRTGAVLAVAWANAAVTFTQLIFKPAAASARGRSS